MHVVYIKSFKVQDLEKVERRLIWLTARRHDMYVPSGTLAVGTMNEEGILPFKYTGFGSEDEGFTLARSSLRMGLTKASERLKELDHYSTELEEFRSRMRGEYLLAFREVEAAEIAFEHGYRALPATSELSQSSWPELAKLEQRSQTAP
ncbi:MAG: hypothetical protein AB199_02940 [Parcubacteria bacterium C7867-004]|nr:MAG: hypothetical protein AB199_02940 [Parcubacteria bacterium C7867-004]